MMLSPIMMQMGTHTFNLLANVVNVGGAADLEKLWSDTSATEKFVHWSTSCLTVDQKHRAHQGHELAKLLRDEKERKEQDEKERQEQAIQKELQSFLKSKAKSKVLPSA